MDELLRGIDKYTALVCAATDYASSCEYMRALDEFYTKLAEIEPNYASVR